MSNRNFVSGRRLRSYYFSFGLLGAWIMGLSYGHQVFGDQQFVMASGKAGSTLASAGTSILQIGHLGQCLVCLGYLYVAWQLPSLLLEKSSLPERVVKLSIAIAVIVCLTRLAIAPTWGYGTVTLLPFLFNLAFNVPLLQMVRQAEESRPASGPKL